MSAAFFGAFQPRHLQITRGGWGLPSRTSHSPVSSPLASKNRRCSMLLITLDAQSEAEWGAKLERVQVMLRNRIPPADARNNALRPRYLLSLTYCDQWWHLISRRFDALVSTSRINSRLVFSLFRLSAQEKSRLPLYSWPYFWALFVQSRRSKSVNLWGNGSSPMLISIWRKRVPIERSILAYSPLTAPHSVPNFGYPPNQKVEDIVPLVEAWNANVSATNAGPVLLAFMATVSQHLILGCGL